MIAEPQFMSDVTHILSQIESGDPSAADQLLPLVYDELRKLAAVRMLRESPEQTLQATALVHEAYLRLVDVDRVQTWNSRGHFFAAAAEVMRRIIVERARHSSSQKAGGGLRRREMPDIGTGRGFSALELLALNEAIEKLEARNPRQAQLVKLRFFAGLTMQQAASAIGISSSTADNDWAYAKCWLRLEMSGDVVPLPLNSEIS